MRATLVLLLTTLAFLASFFVVPPPASHAKQGDAAIGAARLATVHVANGSSRGVRNTERTPGPAIALSVFAVEPAAFAHVPAETPPKQHAFSAPDRSLLMVFLI